MDGSSGFDVTTDHLLWEIFKGFPIIYSCNPQSKPSLSALILRSAVDWWLISSPHHYLTSYSIYTNGFLDDMYL
ncbi:hypothetical protein L1987_65192 [Smallanthus sonchifolius]|uniref:Uncharacterized protein n=1 Tax=Smallanthus sonchifolius TaxID=185202 RepID=A0ACB9BTN4_9ASTR|nr:hypothetical protein L1987_65192 [Smallanthus sonchifolius]